MRALILAPTDTASTARRISGQGCDVDHEDELFSALDRLMCDPSGYRLFVMDADAFGGLEAGRRAFRLLGDLVHRISVILISSDCAEQEFAEGRDAPTVLRAPVSAISMSVALENSLRAGKALYA